MFGDSPFDNPVPAFQNPVAPPGSDPFMTPYVTVCFNERWLKYVVTCLYQLVLQSTWKVTSQAELDLVQAQAMTLIGLFIRGCNPPNPQAYPGVGGGDEFMLRQNPDNPCELQSSVDGVTWCTWADLSKCKPNVTQPGGGSPQPPPQGGQACYHGIVAASEQWLVPAVVNAGDQITFSNVSGAGADGGIDGLWYCPNGQTFFAGACIGVPGVKTADIANTIAHMRLIVNINGVWYDAYNTGFTVPGGVVNSPVIVQINDSNIADNSGSYAFDVCLTNNTQAEWEQTFNFGVTDGGFEPSLGTDGDKPYAFYSPGLGWVVNCTLDDNGGGRYQYLIVRKTTSRAGTITHFEATYNRGAVGTPALPLGDALYIQPSNVFLRQSNYPTGNNLLMTWDGTASIGSGEIIGINITQDFQYPGGTSCPLVTPSAVLTKVVLRGVGVNPFVT